MDANHALVSMLANLERWRHLPKYQLERRADLFFGLFIRDIVGQRFSGIELHEVVIPEYPFRHGDNHQTVNIDYLLFARDLSHVFAVELKTDGKSLRGDQCKYLYEFAAGSFCERVGDLKMVMDNSRDTAKYRYLADMLKQVGILADDGTFTWNASIPDPTLKVVFLMPESSSAEKCSEGAEIIFFSEAAKTVEAVGGDVGCLFADSLLRWQEFPAGKLYK